MLLRWLVTQYVRQAAQEKLREVVVDTARQHLENQTGGGHSGGGRHEAGEADEPFVCGGAVLFALGIEAGGLNDLLQQARTSRGPGWKGTSGNLRGRSLLVAETGVGQSSAAEATRRLIDEFKPPWIVSTGFAGTLTPDIRRGGIVLVDNIVDEHGEQIDTGLAIDPATVSAARGVFMGRLLTVDRLVRRREERARLAETYSADVCDMETMAVARVCRERGVRFLAVRIVSDGIDDAMPEEVEKLLDRPSLAGKLGIAAGAMFRRPSVVKDMWKLRETAIATSDRLAKFLVGMIDQLPVE
ncbi:MAG: hypothetical protein KDA55_10080 [Planctomycetales bacterium]|nr:hypothetical protein [Planctomycetales bacterium]